MSIQFNSLEEAKNFLSKVEDNLKQFEDEEYNLNQDILKTKEEIGVLKNLQDDLRRSNYNYFCQQSYNERTIEEVVEPELTIDDLIRNLK